MATTRPRILYTPSEFVEAELTRRAAISGDAVARQTGTDLGLLYDLLSNARAGLPRYSVGELAAIGDLIRGARFAGVGQHLALEAADHDDPATSALSVRLLALDATSDLALTDALALWLAKGLPATAEGFRAVGLQTS